MDNNITWEVLMIPYVMLGTEAVPIRSAISIKSPCPPYSGECHAYSLVDSDRVMASWNDSRNTTNSPIEVDDMVRDLIFNIGYSMRDITIGILYPSEFMICPKNTGSDIEEVERPNNVTWEIFIVPYVTIKGEKVPQRTGGYTPTLCPPTGSVSCPPMATVISGVIWASFKRTNSFEIAKDSVMTLINEYGYSPFDIKVMCVHPTSFVQCR